MDDDELIDGRDDSSPVFVAPPVRNGYLAPSFVASMRELGASEQMLAVVTAQGGVTNLDGLP